MTAPNRTGFPISVRRNRIRQREEFLAGWYSQARDLDDSARTNPFPGYKWAFSPRVGIAYHVRPGTVVRIKWRALVRCFEDDRWEHAL